MELTPEAASPNGPIPAPLPRLSPGTVLRGRFTVERFLGRGLLGEIYSAGDATDGKPVLLKLLPRELLRDAQGRSRAQQDAVIAGQLDHKNISACYGFFADGENLFIASEVVDGQTARQMLENKKQVAGKSFTLKGAYNVVTHLCNALEYAHATMVHGVLCSETVVVNAAGRVKITDFGLARSLPHQERFRAALAPSALAAMAPELVQNPDGADRRADIYSIGALLYELLSGKPRLDHDEFLSRTVPGVPPAVDAVIEQCMAQLPDERYADAAELKRAIHAACEPAFAAAQATASRPPPPPGGGARPPAAPGRATGPTPPRGAPGTAAAGAAPKIPSTFSVDSALSAVDEAHERWLIQKDKLDFGPFRLGDVKVQIESGQIRGEHTIVDMENGERRRVKDHPLLKEMVLLAEGKIEQASEQARLEAEARAHRRHVLTIVSIVGMVLLTGGGVFVFLVLPKMMHERVVVKKEIVEKEGDLSVTFNMMKVDPPPPKGKKHHSRGPGQKGGPDEFDGPQNLGDANSEGGDETLGEDVVQKVMMANFKVLGGCLREEKSRNPATRSVDFDFIIKGNGLVSAVKANGQTSSPLSSCIYGKMQAVQFPKFNGSRTHASFSLALK